MHSNLYAEITGLVRAGIVDGVAGAEVMAEAAGVGVVTADIDSPRDRPRASGPQRPSAQRAPTAIASWPLALL